MKLLLVVYFVRIEKCIITNCSRSSTASHATLVCNKCIQSNNVNEIIMSQNQQFNKGKKRHNVDYNNASPRTKRRRTKELKDVVGSDLDAFMIDMNKKKNKIKDLKKNMATFMSCFKLF